MSHKSGSQDFQRALHAVPQLLPDSSALLNALVVVLLQKALVGVNAFAREPGGVKQAVENDKLAVGVTLDHGPEVELHVRGLGEAGAVPQQPQLLSIGHHSPEGLRAV